MCFFFNPPVRRVPIPTGIQRKLNFVSVRTIKGRSSSKRGSRAPSERMPKKLQQLLWINKREQHEKSKGVPCLFGGGDRAKWKFAKVGITRLAGYSDGHWSP
jgi:hypothetical protein